MLRYLATRLLYMVPALWLVVSAVFLLIHLAPGDTRSPPRPPPHNLNHPLYKIRFFKLRFFFVASLPKIGYKKQTGRARVISTDGP
jgi:hypothetical protein